MEQKMFCYQCQETAGCKGCTHVWCVREKTRCSGHAGSVGLCHERDFGCYDCAASGREAGIRRNQSLNHA